MPDYVVSFHEAISEIGAAAWNTLAGTDNPFTRYEFLYALEVTGCTGPRTGWQPCHAALRDQTGELRALVPLYLKSNSWGEYVFDWAWANAYERHGLDYYPKLVTAVPFTPSTGSRLFVKEPAEHDALARHLVDAIQEEAGRRGASSWHVLFPTEKQQDLLVDSGLMPRIACQFHWHNHDYRDFDDFLARLSSRKRKNLRKERARVRDAGIRFEIIEGAEVAAEQWDEFYTFYQSTYLMRGMQGYLSREFFSEVARLMPEQLFMVCAVKESRTIAAALFFKSADSLFGRYWGSASDYQFLHFETCYYQGQEYAIRHGMSRFDSGAQGEHKIQRGFEPTITLSSHWLAEQAFADAVQDFLQTEKNHILHYRDQALQMLPFRQTE